MPAPTMPPMTIMVASKRPRRRASPLEAESPEDGVDDGGEDTMVRRFFRKTRYILTGRFARLVLYHFRDGGLAGDRALKKLRVVRNIFDCRASTVETLL